MARQKIPANVYKRALEIIWLAIIFLVPLFFNPVSHQVFVLNKAAMLEFLVAVMVGLWLADLIMNPAEAKKLNWRKVLKSPLHLSILVFGLLVIVSTVASLTPSISFWGSYFRKAGLLTLICWIVFFLVVAQQIRSRAQIFRAVYTLLLSSGIVSVLGILQYFLPEIMASVFQNPNTFGDRVSSTLGNPLFLSSFLAMVIPFNLALMICLWSKRKENHNVSIFISLAVLLGLQLWCLWLAQYSITILLYVISLIIFLTIWGIVKRKKVVLSLGALSLLALMIIAGILLMPLLFKAPVTETAPQDSPSAATAEELGLSNLGGRVEYWQSAINIVLKSPEVPLSNDKLHALRRAIGYGPETFWITFQLFFPDKYKTAFTDRSLTVDRPHNDYLYLMTTVGILGLVSFLAILAVFFYLCFNYLRRASDDTDKLFIIAMSAAMVQYMADIFFNLSTISPELVFWLILAMIYAIGRYIATESISKTRTMAQTTRARLLLSAGCVLVFIIIGTSIAIRPPLADVYLEKGVKLQDAGSEQAIYAFDSATRIDPAEATYWHALARYDYYVAQHIKGQTFKTKVMAIAAEDQYKAVQLKPYDALENYYMADIYTYWAWSGDPDKWPAAMSYYDKAAQLYPDNAVILDKWATALIIKGDLDEAGTKLQYAANVDPNWAKTSFLSGLLLAKEDKNGESATELTKPIHDNAANLNQFIGLCSILQLYDMVSPLGDSLQAYSQENPDDWTAQALLGITSVFNDNASESIDEFNAAMRLVPEDDAGALFQAILKLSTMNQKLAGALPSAAEGWRDKLSRSPDSDQLVPLLDQLLKTPK